MKCLQISLALSFILVWFPPEVLAQNAPTASTLRAKHRELDSALLRKGVREEKQMLKRATCEPEEAYARRQGVSRNN